MLVGASPRGSLALLLLARAVAAHVRPGLRDPRGRQGGRGGGAGAPDHAAAGDVAAPGRLGARGRERARRGAGAGERRAARCTRRRARPARSAPTQRRRGCRRDRVRRAGPDPPAARATRSVGADPGARPGGPARPACWSCSRCCSAGSTWSCSPRRSRSAPRWGLRRPPDRRARGRARGCRRAASAEGGEVTRRAAGRQPEPRSPFDLVVVRVRHSPLAAAAGTRDRPLRDRPGAGPADRGRRWPARRCAGASTRSGRPWPTRVACDGLLISQPVVSRAGATCGSIR